MNGGFNRTNTDKSSIFHCHVWLPEGKWFFQEWTIRWMVLYKLSGSSVFANIKQLKSELVGNHGRTQITVIIRTHMFSANSTIRATLLLHSPLLPWRVRQPEVFRISSSWRLINDEVVWPRIVWEKTMVYPLVNSDNYGKIQPFHGKLTISGHFQ